MADEDDLGESEELETTAKGIEYEALKAIIETISASSSKLIISELHRVMADKRITANANKGLVPYLYASALLSFSGREINEESISNLLRTIDVTPDPSLIKAILDAGIKSHLVYIYAFYFLVANGSEPSEANILGVVRSLGLQPDRARALDILDFISLPDTQ